MLSIPPALSNFSFMSLLIVKDMFNIFKVEPLHTISLGIRKILKECIYIMLKDDERSSISVPYFGEQARPFKFLKE